MSTESEKLKLLFKEQPLTQKEFASTYELGSPAMVWQYLNGESALNIQAALKFAKGIGCEVADFSPRLAKLLPVERVVVERHLLEGAYLLTLLAKIPESRKMEAYMAATQALIRFIPDANSAPLATHGHDVDAPESSKTP